MKKLLFTIALFSVQMISAKEYYVANCGSDSNAGTIESPFQTITKALSVVEPGDRCLLREGEYREDVVINGVQGSNTQPIIIEPYNGEEVTFSGTTLVDGAKWVKHSENIYKTKFTTPIWQLFVDGRSMSSARWPNANWDDGSLWDRTNSMVWPESGELGYYTNEELKELDFSMEGGMIVVNSGSFRTYQSRITEHKAGSNNFHYDTNGVQAHFSTVDRPELHGYFFEGKKELIDCPEEWFYDNDEQMLYLYLPGGAKPVKQIIEGKRQTFFFDGVDCKYITIKGVNFFGTTVQFHDCEGITLEDCKFDYPTFNRRMAGSLQITQPTTISQSSPEGVANSKIINCHFKYGDGPALSLSGVGYNVENCSFHYFDFSCLNGGGYMFDMVGSTNSTFRRNTASHTGNSEMLMVGKKSVVELNDMSVCGLLQNDGSLIQVGVGQQPGTVVRYNWVHNSPRQGIRFDNSNLPNSPWGKGCSVHHNVAWETDRCFFKGDEHYIYGNLVYDSILNDLIPSANTSINGFNYKTITRNNISNKFSGDINEITEVPGVVDHNWAGNEQNKDIRSQLRDPDNRDFRPKADSDLVDTGALVNGKTFSYVGSAPDIGPYEFGDENYWIPGFQDSRASVAIPTNGSTTVKKDADLMWLPAYKSTESHIYVGSTDDNMTLRSKQRNNIYELEGLTPATTYYWRVDCVVDGEIVQGDVWKFRTEK